MVNDTCSIDGCETRKRKRGWCNGHYNAYLRHGDPLVRLREWQPEFCSVDGCDGKPKTKKLCPRHYSRLQKNGRTNLIRLSAQDRFWAKVDIGHPLSCWAWMGAASTYGYFEDVPAHRVAYGYLMGGPPADLDLDHLCRNRLCVNPDHLEPVTRAENLRRARESKFA